MPSSLYIHAYIDTKCAQDSRSFLATLPRFSRLSRRRLSSPNSRFLHHSSPPFCTVNCPGSESTSDPPWAPSPYRTLPTGTLSSSQSVKLRPFPRRSSSTPHNRSPHSSSLLHHHHHHHPPHLSTTTFSPSASVPSSSSPTSTAPSPTTLARYWTRFSPFSTTINVNSPTALPLQLPGTTSSWI